MSTKEHQGSMGTVAIRVGAAALIVVFLIGLLPISEVANLTSLNLLTYVSGHLAVTVLIIGLGIWALLERKSSRRSARRLVLALLPADGLLVIVLGSWQILYPAYEVPLRLPLTVLGYGFGLLAVIAFSVGEKA
jgi:hypothetical protein